MLRLCTSRPQDSGNRPSTKRERRRGISAARHTAPAEGVPSLATALVKCRNGVARPGLRLIPAGAMAPPATRSGFTLPVDRRRRAARLAAHPLRSCCALPTASSDGNMLSYIARASRIKRARSSSDLGTKRMTSPMGALQGWQYIPPAVGLSLQSWKTPSHHKNLFLDGRRPVKNPPPFAAH